MKAKCLCLTIIIAAACAGAGCGSQAPAPDLMQSKVAYTKCRELYAAASRCAGLNDVARAPNTDSSGNWGNTDSTPVTGGP